MTTRLALLEIENSGEFGQNRQQKRTKSKLTLGMDKFDGFFESVVYTSGILGGVKCAPTVWSMQCLTRVFYPMFLGFSVVLLFLLWTAQPFS